MKTTLFAILLTLSLSSIANEESSQTTNTADIYTLVRDILK